MKLFYGCAQCGRVFDDKGVSHTLENAKKRFPGKYETDWGVSHGAVASQDCAIAEHGSEEVAKKIYSRYDQLRKNCR